MSLLFTWIRLHRSSSDTARRQSILTLQGEVHIKLIETRDHILGAFDRHISEFADKQFARQGIEVVYNSRVSRRFSQYSSGDLQACCQNIMCCHNNNFAARQR